MARCEELDVWYLVIDLEFGYYVLLPDEPSDVECEQVTLEDPVVDFPRQEP